MSTDDVSAFVLLAARRRRAIIPSAVQADRYRLRVVRVTYLGKPLREPLAIFWEKRRLMPAYATAFRTMLAAYAREVFPISGPSEPKRSATTRRKPQRY